MSLPIKVGIGILTAGSIVGASYAGVSYFSKEDKKEVNSTQQGTAISKLIEEEYKFKLLDTSEGSGNKDESHWASNWKTYKTDNNGRDIDILSLKNWNKTTPGDSTEALKAKCKELATEKVTDSTDGLYQNVTKYCTRGITVEEEAKKNQITILDTGSSSKDSKVWKLRHSKATDLKSDLNKLGIDQTDPTEENIKSGCNTAKAKNKKEATNQYQQIYDAYVKVCTRQASDPTD